MPAFPIARYLVPADAPGPGDAFARMKVPLVRGVPATVPLDATLDLALIVPTGVARVWIDLDPSTIVLDSADDEVPRPPAAGAPILAPPARFALRESGTIRCTVPLVAGLSRILPDAGGATDGKIGLWIAGYRIHAGTVLGAGDYGSFVDLAWRRADKGVNDFELPPLPLGLYARALLALESFAEALS